MPFHGKWCSRNLIKSFRSNIFMMTYTWNVFLCFLVVICKVTQLFFAHGEFRLNFHVSFRCSLKFIIIRIGFIACYFRNSLIKNFLFFTFYWHVSFSNLGVNFWIFFVIFVSRYALTSFNGCFNEPTTFKIFRNYFTTFL